MKISGHPILCKAQNVKMIVSFLTCHRQNKVQKAQWIFSACHRLNLIYSVVWHIFHECVLACYRARENTHTYKRHWSAQSYQGSRDEHTFWIISHKNLGCSCTIEKKRENNLGRAWICMRVYFEICIRVCVSWAWLQAFIHAYRHYSCTCCECVYANMHIMHAAQVKCN